MNDLFSISLATDYPENSTGPAHPRTVTVRLAGEIDMVAIPALQQVLGEAWGQHPQRLVVDLADVSYLSMSAIGPLLKARWIGERDGVSVALCDPRRAIRRFLTWAGLADALEPMGQPATRETTFRRV
jgi:anti-anti-sigma factor